MHIAFKSTSTSSEKGRGGDCRMAKAEQNAGRSCQSPHGGDSLKQETFENNFVNSRKQ